MNLRVIEEQCIGCGSCEMACPEYFKMNDDGIAEVLKQPEEIKDEIQEAIDVCPTEAIVHD